jgi:Uma2 family endonuclease
VPAEPHLVLHNISWQMYEELRDNEANWGVRMTYDHGRLEMMTPSRRHERFSGHLHELIVATAEEFKIPIDTSGSTTWKRPDLAAALEADECFYIQHEAVVRGRDELDLTVDPPPDLAIEVEVSRSAVSKMNIYATLRVPEVWCYDGKRLRVLQLNPQGQYAESNASGCMPELPMDGVERFMQQRSEMDLISWLSAYRAWLREVIAKRPS